MTQAKKGDWVQVHQIVLNPEERPSHVPEDTRKVPLELWVKGFIEEDASIGEEVEITTLTGRKVKGELVAINPAYEHDFGDFVPEILKIGIQVRNILKDGESHE
jgi:2-amino-4-ketopentanoate thiolase alpha subunit